MTETSRHAAASVRARLGDADSEARRLATQEIPSLPAPESCDLLLVALADEDWRVRKEAVAVAAKVEPRTAVVFATLRALGARDDIGLRNAAVEALVLIGPDAVPGAVDALGRLDADGRKLAVEVLAGVPTLAGMRALAGAVRDPDTNVAVAAAEALGRASLAGEEARELATAELSGCLASEDPQLRLAVLASLTSLEAEVPWTALEPLLADPILRRSALAAAAGNRAPRALRQLAEACADPSATMAREAVLALARSIEETWDEAELLDIPAKTLRASRGAHERLRGFAAEPTDPWLRGAAILALGLIRDPDDVAVIADALADDEIAELAEAALRLYGQEAVEPLLERGRTAAPMLRGATISMLPQLAPDRVQPLSAMREALVDPSPEVVAPALKSLAIVGTADDLAGVAALVSSKDPRVAVSARAALHAIAGRHPVAARGMLDGVDPRGDAAHAGAIILDALLRASDRQATDRDFLEGALTHREAAVRRAAIDALSSLGGEGAAQAVTFSLADEEPVVALAAIRALGRLGRSEQLASLAATTKDPTRLGTVLRALADADPVRAVAAAKPLLRSREAAITAAAVDVIGSIPFEGRVEALMSAADDASTEVVKLALSRLVETGDDRTFTALARAIDHASDMVRKYAAELLGNTGGAEAESLLRARLDRERSADVRRVIMEALSTRGGLT